jgi:hypothetical protein
MAAVEPLSLLEDGISVPGPLIAGRGAQCTVPRPLIVGRRQQCSWPLFCWQMAQCTLLHLFMADGSSVPSALIGGRWQQCTSPLLLLADSSCVPATLFASSVPSHSHCWKMTAACTCHPYCWQMAAVYLSILFVGR